ncbi:MAG: DUF2851 family protein [Sphingobacteriales bacterium]|nr:DUF2851 family protein [Sphingobacteriales bacterium]
MYRNYQQLQYTEAWVPCAKLIKNIDSFVLTNWLDRVLVERLEQKTEPLLQTLQQNNYGWEETCYQANCRAFQHLTSMHNPSRYCTLVAFGNIGQTQRPTVAVRGNVVWTSGFARQNFRRTVSPKLRQRYQFLQAKFGLKPLLAHSWKTGGLRPPNFPTVRIAQFAALIHQSSRLVF